MALVVSSTPVLSTPDPTAELQTALTNFENSLTVEQKRSFHNHIQNYNQQRPDASSVVQFAAQIDAENHGKTRKSMSPRLCTFLDSTRQFTDVVNTFVSSNPVIAALIWGGIKTAILIISNIGSYFDKVSRILLTVGHMCPIYRDFSHLYSDSIALQQALCEYYAVVINLVTKIVKVSQRTVVTGILSSIVLSFESEFGPFNDDLATASEKVKLQISIAATRAAQASAKLLELEQKDSRRYRSLSRKFMSEARAEHNAMQQLREQENARHTAKMRSYIKDQLSTINPQITWKKAQRQRLPGTAEWFRTEQTFKDWKGVPQTATLWCPGRLGAGKTILVSNIIANLHACLQLSDVIAYHFCSSEITASLDARNILGTLARQILDKHIDQTHGDELQNLREACKDANTEDITDLILSHLEAHKKYYIIVDGLDECSQDQIVEFIKSVAKILDQQYFNIKLLYSGRPELERQLFQKHEAKYRLSIDKSSVRPDIEHYIKKELDYCLETSKIVLTNPEAILKIRDALYTKHDGLILFVRLFIEELCILGNENAIIEALDNLPKNINDLFTARLRRARAHELCEDALRILRYCGCTKRPLTVNEFGELLSISLSQKSLDHTRIPQNMYEIITACYGLVYVEEDEETIHYVHHSVKHHLFNNSDTGYEDFVENEVDMHLGCVCLIYLNFNDFRRQLVKVNAISNKLVTPLGMGLVSVQNSSGSSSIINNTARKLLQACNLSSGMTTGELSRKTEDVLGETEYSLLKTELHSRPYHLLRYVQKYWVWHSVNFDQNSKMWNSFSVCVRGGNHLAKRPWIQDKDQQQTNDPDSSLSMKWALVHNHWALVLFNLIRESSSLPTESKSDALTGAIKTNNFGLMNAVVNSLSPNGLNISHNVQNNLNDPDANLLQRGLWLAARYANENALEMFITAQVCIDSEHDLYDSTALLVAASHGHLKVVDRLLQAGADVDQTDRYGETALYRAAKEGHLEVVDRLLQAGADVIQSDRYGETALHRAATEGHLEVVDRLRQAGANVNQSDRYGETALYRAAKEDHLEVVDRLLQAGADVNYPGLKGETALYRAAKEGHLEVVSRLLQAGADVNYPGLKGETALYRVATEGHLEVVNRLLQAGADVNQSDRYGETALHRAATEGHLEVVDRLLQAGANVNDTDRYGETTLHRAAKKGHLEVVDRLLQARANVNDTDSYGRTALYYTAKEDHLEVVDRLLQAGADVIQSDRYGETALYRAAKEGHLEVVDRLLQAGANVNQSDRYGETALYRAAKEGHLEVVDRLLQAGADVNQSDRYGETALNRAAKEGHLEVVDRLIAARADP